MVFARDVDEDGHPMYVVEYEEAGEAVRMETYSRIWLVRYLRNLEESGKRISAHVFLELRLETEFLGRKRNMNTALHRSRYMELCQELGVRPYRPNASKSGSYLGDTLSVHYGEVFA